MSFRLDCTSPFRIWTVNFFLNKVFVNEDPYCPRTVKCIERTEGPVFTLLLNELHFNGTDFVNVYFTNMMNGVYRSFQK